MIPEINSVVAALKQAKGEGLTYEQAKEQLRQKGYRDEQITQASYQFDYSGTAAAGSNEPPVQNEPALTETGYAQMGNSILSDRSASQRVYVYFLGGPLAYVATTLYLIIYKHYAWFDKQMYVKDLSATTVVSIATIVLTILAIKTYYYFYDQRK